MRNRLFTIILLNIFILMLLLIFHEKIATNIDSIIMPNSAELCKTISANLSKLKELYSKSTFYFILNFS